MSIGDRIAILAQEIDALNKDIAQDDISRKQLLDVLQGAAAKVESPVEMIWRMMMSVSNCLSLKSKMGPKYEPLASPMAQLLSWS